MKKIFVLCCFILSLCFCISCKDDEPIDEIETYTIIVNQRSDGTLNMQYDIRWRVIEDAGEKLSWVEIGIPNQNINDITYSKDVSNAYYFSNNGDFIRCDLKKGYYEGDVIDIAFAFHLTHLYTFDEQKIYYEFIPGWFNEIEVKSLKVFWNKENVETCNTSTTRGEYYVWEYKLEKGESIKVNVEYPRDLYPNLITASNNSKTFKGNNDWIGLCFVFGWIFFIFVLILIINRCSTDEYHSYRGFSGRNFYRYHMFRSWHTGYNKQGKKYEKPKIVNNGGRSSGGSSCACACACACAGGGRAGCARKDFYHPNLEIDKLKEKLEK